MPTIGRPTLYNDEVADRICEELMFGRSLRRICDDDDGMPAFRTVLHWLARPDHPFCIKYAHARDVQAEVGADDLQDIADTPQIGVVETDKLDKDGDDFTEVRRADMIEHRKLRIAVRQWNAEKLRPKRFGSKQMIEHSGSIDLNHFDNSDELMSQIMELLASGRVKLPNGVMLEEGDDEEDDPHDVG